MKKLYLVRHAKSSWKNPSLDDFKRPLNNRGKRDAPFMGNLLHKKGVLPEIVFSSTAKRASKTAEVICKKINYPLNKINYIDEIYEASANQLLGIIKSTNEKYSSVMLFAHNPGLTFLQNKLCEKQIENIPTCGIVCLELTSSWRDLEENSTKLFFFEYPKLYFKNK